MNVVLNRRSTNSQNTFFEMFDTLRKKRVMQIKTTLKLSLISVKMDVTKKTQVTDACERRLLIPLQEGRQTSGTTMGINMEVPQNHPTTSLLNICKKETYFLPQKHWHVHPYYCSLYNTREIEPHWCPSTEWVMSLWHIHTT